MFSSSNYRKHSPVLHYNITITYNTILVKMSKDILSSIPMPPKLHEESTSKIFRLEDLLHRKPRPSAKTIETVYKAIKILKSMDAQSTSPPLTYKKFKR